MSSGCGARDTHQESNDFQPSSASFGRMNSAGSSLRRLFSFSDGYVSRLDEDIESEIVSQAGDIGDSVRSRRGSERFSLDHATENGVVVPIPEDIMLQSYSFRSRGPSVLTVLSPVTSLPSQSPLPTDAILHSEGKKPEDKNTLLSLMEYISYMVHLAVFGILGVLTRFLLQKLFGPGVVGVTSDGSILYIDLPSNMVGSFLMGWFGCVFKPNISYLSDQLAVGLTTGYLGSVTTFSGWNQKMLDLSVKGHWVFAVLGYIIGLFLVAYSIIFGIETAQGFRWLFRNLSSKCKWRVDSSKRHAIVVTVVTLMWSVLWVVFGILERKKFKSGGSGAQLWLGCLVAPFGVWTRWWLARLNGHGLGKEGSWKWIPFGTLIANVTAACLMAALAVVKRAVDTQKSDTVASGIRLGFLGCLSTVSTFIAEFNAMRQSSHPWRAYVYAIMTFTISFGLGTLIYSVPVWLKGYK